MATSHSRRASSSAVTVPKVLVTTSRCPSAPGVRTQVTTVSLCTSIPAHRCTTTSITPPCPLDWDRPEEPLVGNSRVRALDNSSGCSRLQRHTHMRARSTKATRRRWPAPTYFPGLGVRHKSAQILIGKYSQPVSLILHPLANGLPGRAQGQGAVSVCRIIEPTPCPYPLDPGIPLHIGPTA